MGKSPKNAVLRCEYSGAQTGVQIVLDVQVTELSHKNPGPMHVWIRECIAMCG